MEELCTACLCAGRRLSCITDNISCQLFSEILNEIPVYPGMEPRVCWECAALLRRFGRFRDVVRASYVTLLQHLQQNLSPKCIAAVPHLKVCHVSSVWCPLEVKTEPLDVDLAHDADIKVEEHVEETFVNALETPASKRDAKTPKVKKKVKKKIKGKEKKKPPPVEDLSHSEDISDVESLTDYKGDAELTDPKDECVKEEVRTEQHSVPPNKMPKVKKKVKKKIKSKKKKKPPPVEDLSHLEDISNMESLIDYKGDADLTDLKDECVKEELRTEKDSVPPNKLQAIFKDRRTRQPVVAGERPQCTECGKIFSSRKTYRYHLNVLHRGQNRYPCPRCGKVYQWKSNLGRHMRSHKARDSGELYCEACDKRFASVATYRQHLRISRRHVTESEFTFSCNDCGKKFVNKTRLRDHIDWEHLKKIKFKCQLCNKPFKCHTSLYVHMQNVHRNKEKKDNLCHVCGKSYQNPAKLKYHIVAMHTSETPYQCQQCPAAFGWYSSLYRHVREVHYKMKLQPKKSKKGKKPSNEMLPSLIPPQHMLLPPLPQPGPASLALCSTD